MKTFLRLEFDKLLLAGLLLMFCALAWHAYRSAAAGLVAFATDQAKVFGGALLGLITGHALLPTKGAPPSQGPSEDQ